VGGEDQILLPWPRGIATLRRVSAGTDAQKNTNAKSNRGVHCDLPAEPFKYARGRSCRELFKVHAHGTLRRPDTTPQQLKTKDSSQGQTIGTIIREHKCPMRDLK
jgi:hypothetical protein